MTKPDVMSFFDAATFTWTYLVSDPDTGDAAIIDPVLDYEPKGAAVSHAGLERLLAVIAQRRLTLRWIMDTHAHADHLSGGDWLRERTGAPLVIGAHIDQVQREFAPRFAMDDLPTDGRQFDLLASDGASFALGQLPVRVMHTPGHTPACVTYIIGDAAFVGDTLFMPDYGTARCDFPGGDAAMLYRSIQTILALPPETRIFLGHDYLPAGRSDYACETSVAAQRAGNVHVHDGVNEADFVAMRRARDATLAPPLLILPSLQVNIDAGRLPPADAAGRRFMKLPISMI